MYLATTAIAGITSYQIRQSYEDLDSGRFLHRLVFDLGPNPTDYLEVIDEVAVWFSTELEQAVSRHTEADPALLLERLLHGFLPRATRDHLNRFSRTERFVPGVLTARQQQEIDRQIHLFDRRRLYYLHYRAIDQSRLFTMRERVCRPLLGQSRDEREYYFQARETSLSPGEYRKYLYGIFQLQRFFSQIFAGWLPEALPEDEVADRFVEMLCELNHSPSFWSGEPTTNELHPHLRRYLVMFFDYSPERPSFEQEFVRRFMGSHRTFRWPKHAPTVSDERTRAIFGKSPDELRKMGKQELTRLFRQKAMQLHPDRGGDQQSFVELTEVYSSLRRGP
jgi:hypothetical protein